MYDNSTHPTAARLFLVALFIYNANGRQLGAVDTIPARFLPYSILREGNFNLDEFRFLYAHSMPAYLVHSSGHLVSVYPPGPAILALPFYLLPVFGGMSPTSKSLIDVEKIAAAVLTALSVGLLFATLRRLGGERAALTLSLIYAFGTSALSISSQALWQHGPSQLLLAASLYCLVRGIEEEKWAAFAGFTLGWAVVCRPTDFLIAVTLALYVFHAHRSRVPCFTLLALPSIIFMALYIYWYFPSVFRVGYDRGFFTAHGWATPFLEGSSGILFSPSRGLFVYSPVFLFSLMGCFLAWRHSEPLLLKYVSVSVFSVIALYSKWSIWWGGWAFGPRLLADITPLLILLLIPAFQRTEPRPILRRSFYALAGISMTIHALGAFANVGWSPDVGEPSKRLWSWSDGELASSILGLRSKVTGKLYLQDIPKVGISTERERYSRGDEVSVTLDVQAGRNPIAFDGYLQILRNGQRFRFVSSKGLSDSPTPFVMSSSTAGHHEFMLSFWIPPDFLPGSYTLQALLFKAGASLGNMGGRQNRLFESQSSTFTVSDRLRPAAGAPAIARV